MLLNPAGCTLAGSQKWGLFSSEREGEGAPHADAPPSRALREPRPGAAARSTAPGAAPSRGGSDAQTAPPRRALRGRPTPQPRRLLPKAFPRDLQTPFPAASTPSQPPLPPNHRSVLTPLALPPDPPQHRTPPWPRTHQRCAGAEQQQQHREAPQLRGHLRAARTAQQRAGAGNGLCCRRPPRPLPAPPPRRKRPAPLPAPRPAPVRPRTPPRCDRSWGERGGVGRVEGGYGVDGGGVGEDGGVEG